LPAIRRGGFFHCVRDPETDEWSSWQFHATFNNIVLAVMDEETAKLFARFVTSTLGDDGEPDHG